MDHESLLLQLLRPSFCPSNACLAVKKDRALSLCLLTCFKVRDRLLKEHNKVCDALNKIESAATRGVENGLSHSTLRALVVSELHTMGIAEPELSVKSKGQVGSDVIDRIVHAFFDSPPKEASKEASKIAHSECTVQQGLPECPAAAAVVSAVAAQEVIKAVTHMYTPISQFLMFDGIGFSDENGQGSSIPQAKASADKSPAGGPVRAEELKGSATKQPLRRRLLRKAKDLLHLSDASTSDLSEPVLLPATTLTTDPGNDSSVSTSDATTTSSNVLAQLYGTEVIEELQSLRVFVVGAGAIGSEILKNLALLGVGSGTSQHSDNTPVVTQDRGSAGFTSSGKGGMKNSTVSALKVPRTLGRKSLWEKQGLHQGGIVVTDMDKIERSNLNRQLLFRFVLSY